MSHQLKNMIEQYKTGQLKELKFCNETFSSETIFDAYLGFSYFADVNFMDLHFTNVDLDLSLFADCSFVNCSFDTTLFGEASITNCNFKNCSLKNCNFKSANLNEIKFDNCSFEKGERGSFAETWFRSCHFIETDFNSFDAMSLIVTVVENGTFSKFKKSIQFRGQFLLIDIVGSKTGIEGMLGRI